MEMATLIQVVVAVAGGIIGAFVAGYTIFFPLGRSIGENRGISIIRDREATIERQNQSLALVTEEMATLRDELMVLHAKQNEPPSQSDVDGLTALLENEEQDIWLSFPSRRSSAHDNFVGTTKCPIVSIVNLKGGVSKTTVAANLAAYFDRKGKRVLLIDADFQGSLSDNLLQLSETSQSTATVDEWLTSDLDPDVLLRTAMHAGQKLPNTSFVTAFYALASIETKLSMRWLLESLRGKEPPDIRYALARVLHSAAALNRFDLVFIDCPPRLSTATMAGLCASSHVLVPTILDNRSAETIPNFTKMTHHLMAELNPTIRLAGIVPTMTWQMNLTPKEKRIISDTKRSATHLGSREPHFFRHIPWKKRIKELDSGEIAYLDGTEEIKGIFEELGEEVASKIGL